MLRTGNTSASHLRRVYNGEQGGWIKGRESLVFALSIEKCSDYVLPKLPLIVGPHDFPVQVTLSRSELVDTVIYVLTKTYRRSNMHTSTPYYPLDSLHSFSLR